MKVIPFPFLLALLWLISLNTQAQTSASTASFLTYRIAPVSEVPRYAVFKPGKEIPATWFLSWLKSTYRCSEAVDFRLVQNKTDELGITHWRMYETFHGVDVELATLMVHIKNGLVTSFNGLVFPALPEASYVKSNDDLKQSAIQYFGTQSPKETSAASFIWASPNGSDNAEDYLPCHLYQLFSASPLKGEKIYVADKTGEVIWSHSTVYEGDSAGTLKTAFRGKQTSTTYYDNGTFYSKQTGRNIRIISGQQNNAMLTDADNDWSRSDLDSCTLDCMWGTEMTYEMYLNWCGQSSIDNNGMEMLAYSIDGVYINAYWYGSEAHFGGGDPGNNVWPLTSLDVVGHEFTHGFTQYSCGLIYSGESGCLNEALSDVMGSAVEWYADSTSGKFSWDLPSDIGMVFRDMKNPWNSSMPKYYNGQYWNTAVHTGSNVMNYWYYLLSDGDSGTNEVNYKFKVLPIGKKVAAQIAYRLQAYYFTQNSSYQDAADYSMLAGYDIMGNCNNDLDNIKEAWVTVGLTPTVNIPSANTVGLWQTDQSISSSDVSVPLLQISVTPDCTSATQTLSDIYLNTTGTSNPSGVERFVLWSTGKIATFNKQIATPLDTFSAANSIHISLNENLNTGFNYYWVTFDCSKRAAIGDVIDAGLDSIVRNGSPVFPVIPMPKEYTEINYCVPTAGSLFQYYGNFSVLGELSFGSKYKYLDTTYSGKVYNRINDGPTLEKGKATAVTMTFYNKYYVGYYKHATRAWIDFNRDGKFSSSELIADDNGIDDRKAVTYNFTVPNEAKYGKTRMRVATSYDSYATLDPCGTYDYGAIYDFDFYLTPRMYSTRICLGDSARIGIAGDSTLTYSWQDDQQHVLASGKINQLQTFWFKPASSGYKYLGLIATNASGDTVEQYATGVMVFDPVTASFSLGNSIICQGNSTEMWADSLSATHLKNSIRLYYDPALGNQHLVGTNSIYAHLFLADTNSIPANAYKTVGLWGQDRGPGRMVPQSNGSYLLTFNVNEYFQNYENYPTKYLGITFRNEDGSQKESGPIFIDLRDSNLASTNACTWSEFVQSYQWYVNGTAIKDETYSHYQTGTSGKYSLQYRGSLCADQSGQQNLAFDTVAVAGKISYSVSKICLGDTVMFRIIGVRGKMDWQQYDSTTSAWISLGVHNDTLLAIPTTDTWYRLVASSIGGCFTSISDSVNIRITPTAVAGVITANQYGGCKGTSISLSLSGQTGNPGWERYDSVQGKWLAIAQNTNTLTFPLNQSAWYRVKVQSGSCSYAISDSIWLQMSDPKAGSLKANSTTLCEGDTLRLNLTGYAGTVQLQLDNGTGYADYGASGVDSWELPLTTGNYLFRITAGDAFCGPYYSNAISVKVNALPNGSINSQSQRVFCEGTTGNLSASSPSAANTWWYLDGVKTNLTGNSIQVTQPGVYQAMFESAAGCQFTSDTFLVTERVDPKAKVLWQTDGQQFFLLVDSTQLIGYSPSWYRTRGGQPQTISNSAFWLSLSDPSLQPGDLVGCKLISPEGCAFEAAKYTVTGLANSPDYSNSLFTLNPNPSNGLSLLSSPLHTPVNIRLTDMSGKILLAKTGVTLPYSFDEKELASGCYLLHVQYGQQMQVIRWIIARP